MVSSPPKRTRGPNRTSGSWWDHEGALVVVYSGLADGTLALPVRLPSAPSNQPILDHVLGDPARWHKIDLVRSRDPHAEGGWRYEAHLLVLAAPYVGPTATARREAAAVATAGRKAGIDVNVSNITVASHASGRDLTITRVVREPKQRTADRRRSRRDRSRGRRLDRSRRAANPDQYELSARQQRYVQRRQDAGLPPVTLVPRGRRRSRSDGKPIQAYRRDQLSIGYRRERAAQIADAASATQARRDHARAVAATLVSTHGFDLIVEDCRPSAWARLWGRSLAAFSPALLVAAIGREAADVARRAGRTGGVVRASTQTTALSQHCLCGHRVAKRLGDRVHRCLACGLAGDRDAIAATLGAFVVVGDRDEPSSAYVDFDASRAALRDRRTHTVLDDTLDVVVMGRQDVPSESNAHSARDGWSVAEKGQTPDAVWWRVARRSVGMAPRPTPDEPGTWCQTTSDRAWRRTNMFGNRGTTLPLLRDTS